MKIELTDEMRIWLDKHKGCDLIRTANEFQKKFHIPDEILYGVIKKWEDS